MEQALSQDGCTGHRGPLLLWVLRAGKQPLPWEWELELVLYLGIKALALTLSLPLHRLSLPAGGLWGHPCSPPQAPQRLLPPSSRAPLGAMWCPAQAGKGLGPSPQGCTTEKTEPHLSASFSSHPCQRRQPRCHRVITIKSERDISQLEANVNVMGEEIKLCTTVLTLPAVHQKRGITGQGRTVHIKEKNFHRYKFMRIHRKNYLFVYAELQY